MTSTEISVSRDFIDPVNEAVDSIFSTMLDVKAEKEGVYLTDDYAIKYDVSGIMGITGDINGNIAVSMSHDVACRAITKMLGDEMTELDDTVCDGVGELINMISGETKRICAENSKVNFDISLPAIITGYGHRIKNNSKVPTILVAYKTDIGNEFAIQLALVKN
jgi:chemotaxis protein CheX